MNDFAANDDPVPAMVGFGRMAYARGWVPATSGNFSCRVREGIAITVSGRHKGQLGESDIMLLDEHGLPRDERRPSAETALHVMLYRLFPQARAVLHTHSVNATVLSGFASTELWIESYEVLKAFPGVETHETRLRVPVFGNDQNIERMARVVEADFEANGPAPGFLIQGHGLYAWGATVADAARHVEAFEFLFECELLRRRLQT